jgi:glycosyltransferase involved in cell wall biosynthesis
MTAKAKILHVVVAGQIGGAECLLAELVRRPGLSGADHVIALMTPNRALASFLRDTAVTLYDRGRVHENPLAYLWRSYAPADIAWLGRAIAAEKPDILHCHTYGSHVLAVRAGLRFSLPVVRTEHGIRHYRDLTCALNRHWSLQQTTAIIAVSDFVRRRVAGIEPAVADRISVVHNGIDLSRFEPQPPRREGPFTLAAIARLEPVKRLEIAIEALAGLPDIHLAIAGDGAERATLEHLAAKRGLADRVRFHGHLADPRPVLAAADAAINCTREEALSLSALEAGALQRPTIGFAQGGLTESVVDGRTGWLTEDDSVAGFAELLRQAASDRSEAIRRGMAARAHVVAHFGLERMCERYGAVYRSLTGE